MPYLALRKESEVRLDGSEDWKDITFLDRASANQNTPERLLIYVAHVSIVLCIWDHKTWTGYNFSRPCPVVEPPDEDSNSDTDTDDDDEVPREDIFAPDSGDHDMNDAPIWDPRMYFLHVVAIWANLIVQEYTGLVRKLEKLVNKPKEVDYRNDITPLVEHANLILEVLRSVRDFTSKAKDEWKMFSADNDGGMRHFKGLKDRKAKVALGKIRESFSKLARLDRDLERLKARCKESFEILGLSLSVQNNKLGERTYTETLRAANLNRATTGIAQRSEKAAVQTQSISQTNIEYFGGERDIFMFERTPKTFAYSVLVLMVVLRIFICALNPVAQVKSYMAARTARLWRNGAIHHRTAEVDDSIGLDGNVEAVSDV
ncbi:hypothetical protein N0V91_001568 [Didymella pomorum]|uniref:Uncharacterized protein n=1 Tax=Didymella pomorum TaxID=749634 RepID=A0A9W8ZPB9_9PLEO|nr:hypothetical protein N0V91_001568 [Didymella pomorum]